MKNSFLKICVILMVILTMTMSNFILVGNGFISYAINNIATNHQNVEFEAYFKNKEGKKVETLEKELDEEEIFLYLCVNVKKEGYFNGEITLNNSNFVVKQSDNPYVSKIENNTIYLNQLKVGTTEEIKVKVEPMKEEDFQVGLLSMESELNLKGIYRDSTQKDINIKANRKLNLQFVENNTTENVLNDMKVITNKIVTIDGQEKRMIQVAYNMGLQENNYPIKEISSKIEIPAVDGEQAEVQPVVYRNNMKAYEYKYEGTNLELLFKNELSEQGKAIWKTQGSEEAIITCLYNKEAKVEDVVIKAVEKVTLYNGKEIEAKNEITVEEELDSIIEVNAKNAEETIYKGKIEAGIERQYQSETQLKVNFAKTVNEIVMNENASEYIVNEETQEANVFYQRTEIKKEEFDEILGQNGVITITNENGEVIATIDSTSAIDENGNIVMDYTEKEPTAIEIKTTAPVTEGTLNFVHTKTIREQNLEVVKQATALSTTITYHTQEVQTTTKLEAPKTEAKLEVSKETLSTVIENNVEMKAILKGNSEQYSLYNNPTIQFELPEEVQEIKINSIDLMYETELKVKSHEINGHILTIYLEGKQTEYKDLSLEGAVLVVNANVIMNRKSATKDTQITMTYNNEGINQTESKSIRMIAPVDVTAINSIKELNVETIGQEEQKSVMLQRGTDAKQLEAQIEIINNNENNIQNVKVMGTFPTENEENNIASKIVEGITVEGIEGANVYYTENEKATDDLQDETNAWTEDITDASKVSKYLIEVPNMETQESLQGTYKMEVPELLEYNQTAKEGYSVIYTNSLTATENETKATNIELQTGIGPVLETKLTPMIGGKEVTANSTVKNGEVIQYKMQVSNTGSEDISNITIQGNVPEGTTLVTPQDNYEYTGSSYYKELNNKTYETTIDTLKVGQVITGEYEVRVNADTQAGTKLANKIQAKYGDVIKQSNESQLVTENGKIRVSVKRVTDRKVDLYETGSVRYFAMIENISNETQDNVTVKTNLTDNINVKAVKLITGLGTREISYKETEGNREDSEREIEESEANDNYSEENIKTVNLQYSDNLNLGTLAKGETKVLSYDMGISKVENSKEIEFSVTAKQGNDEYISNVRTDNIIKTDVSLSMTTNTQSQYVKSGDTIIYTITVKNNESQRIKGLALKDEIPSSLTVKKVSFDDDEIEELKERNNLEISCEIAPESEAIIKIETVVNYSPARTSPEAITNVAHTTMLGKEVATTSIINHIIEADVEGNDSSQDNDTDNTDVANGNKMITGVAWFDANANGQKDADEALLSNIKVHLLNTTTNNLVKDENGNVLEATTNDKGVYVLDKIGNGKYIVIFEYNNTQYALTKYKAEGVGESENSNVMENELSIDNEKQLVASTDIIEINNENISNINIGLIERKDFSFKLDKYVNRILIQNAAGTTVKEYDNASVAKAELDAKKINGTTVVIEYKIKVTNIGDVDGYVRKIADYMPSDLQFSSELNKDWYQSGNNLYNISLANEKIPAGEAREVTVTLTKSMTEDNTGLINNTAEIAESYNELGLKDNKSTSGNKVQGEQDYSSADAILSLKTGGEVYITIAVLVVAVLGTTAFIVIRKKQNIGDEE